MAETRRNEPRHRLAISVDESSLIDVRHREDHDDFFLTIDQLDELVQRAPQIRAEAVAAWGRATTRTPFADSDIEHLGGDAA